VAENVETEAQMGILREQGCHPIQGFLFARPMPPDDAWQWLTTGPAAAPA
jgi:EAL domain-containing protein (putative c-di-GMP-specific phosphodiesterase class I)